MDKFLQRVVDFTQSRYLKVLTNGFMSVAAVSIAGSIFTLIKSFPIDAWLNFLKTSGMGEILSIPVTITADLLAIYIVFSMGYTLAKSFNKDGFPAAIVALGCFMILTPFTATQVTQNAEGQMITTTMNNVLPVSYLGAKGIFLAIIAAMIASRLYIFCLDKGLKIKMPASVPANVSSMFESMIPGGLVFLVFLFIRLGFSATPYMDAQNFIYSVLQEPLTHIGGGLFGVIVYLGFGKLLWVFGIHGGMVAYAAMAPIMMAANVANISAFAVGEAAPNPEWILQGLCANVGILAFTILLLTSKAKQHKALAKIGIVPALFNITEPILFGTPVIMNPILAIPFVCTPIVSLLLSYGVMKLGIISMVTGASVNNFFPVPIMAAFMNSSLSGAIWGVILIAINIVMYYPFFKIVEKKALAIENSESGAE